MRLLSNNATLDVAQYAATLTQMGLPTREDDVVTTVVTMTRWLLDHAPDAVVFPIAEASLIRAFDDRTLQITFDAIWFHGRARLVATNPDRYCPMPGGHGEPDRAAVVAAIEACSGTTCEVNVGKPDPEMLRAALADLDVDPARAVMVGDRLGTDILLAHTAGTSSALVRTGETRPQDLIGVPVEQLPDLVLERVDQLLPAHLWSELGWSGDEAAPRT